LIQKKVKFGHGKEKHIFLTQHWSHKKQHHIFGIEIILVCGKQTSNEDIKRIAVSWVVITRHGVEWTDSQRISIENEEIRAIPTNNTEGSLTK